MSTWMFVCDNGSMHSWKPFYPAAVHNIEDNPVRRAHMLPRKTRTMGGTKLQQWMRPLIYARMDNIDHDIMHGRDQTSATALMDEWVRFERASMRTNVALKHSSKRRPLIMSIIHARINKRTPGSMLAARAEGRIA